MAEIVHQEVIDIQIKNGDKNIKNLRKQIKELKDDIANLTLNGKDATNAQKKLTEANKELASAMSEVNKVIVDNISDTDTSTMSYNEMSKELNLLRKAAKDAGDTITRQKYSARIQELDKALKSIDAEMGVFNRNVGNYAEGVEKGTASMRQQIKELRDELTRLSPETEEYANKLVLLAEKQKIVADIQEEAKFASQDYGDRLETITKVGTNLASGFAAVQGAMALFGTESENLGKVLVKLQAIMAVVNGLQGLDGLGKNIQGLSRSFAPAIQAVKSFIVGLTGMKAAIAATGIGLLAVGLGAVAANWDKIKAALGGETESQKTIRTTGEKADEFVRKYLDPFYTGPNGTTANKTFDVINFEDFFGIDENKDTFSEDLYKIIKQIKERRQYDLLEEELVPYRIENNKQFAIIKGILKKYGLENLFSEKYGKEGYFVGFGEDQYGVRRRTTPEAVQKILGITDKKDLEAYAAAVNKLEEITEKKSGIEAKMQKLKPTMYPYSLGDLDEKIKETAEIRQSLLTEEQKIIEFYDRKLYSLRGAPDDVIAAVQQEREAKLAELRKKENEENEKAAEKYAEKRNKVYARFQEEGIIAEYEARRRQYVEEMKLFSNNIAMKKKLTVEYLKDIVELNKKYTKKATEELEKAQKAEFEKRVAGLTQQYIEAAAQPTGDTPTQMEVAQPSAWTEDTVLAYAAETAAAQAFYESEIDYQNTVMQNQITILTNMRDIAREMGNTDAAIEYTEQINRLKDSIAANDTKVAEKRVENQKKVEEAEKASNKEGEVTKLTLDNMLSMGQSIGKILGSTASMIDKSSEEGFATYKALATASAVIDTLASAVAAYKSLAGIPLVGHALGAAAAAAAVAAGMANVTQIQKTTLGSTASVENSYGSSSVSAPEINAWEPQYTRNLQTDTETEKLNQPIYVTVTDIKKGLDKQTKVVDAAKF
ncbi:MAG: hypothetical protein UHO61_08295 [Acutalibacteraceae bacterium]|nr:hypothetical protein [Acutalibacteraceae bacterium]